MLSRRTDRQKLACSRSEAQPSIPLYVLYLSQLPSSYTNCPPVIEAEVIHAIRHEYALTATDVLARRTRLAFLNVRAALDALPRVVDIMGKELGWSSSEKKRQTAQAIQFFSTMGLDLAENAGKGRSRFEPGEVTALENAFSLKAVGGEGIRKTEVVEVLKGVKGYGYDAIPSKDWEYVMEEAGLGDRMTARGTKPKDDAEQVGWHEFVEVQLSYLPLLNRHSDSLVLKDLW